MEEKKEKKEIPSVRHFARLIRTELMNETTNPLLLPQKKQDIQTWLSDPQDYQMELRNLSVQLYERSSHYKRLIEYFAKMGLFCYVLYPQVDITTKKISSVKSAYNKASSILEKLNLRQEMTKAFISVFREDVFYGYEHETSTGYFIQKLPPDYCQITSIVDGAYVISFDLDFFRDNENALNGFAEEFRKAYNAYANSNYGESKRMYELDYNRTIVLKYNEDELTYTFPPFAGVFPEIFDLQEFKATRKFKDKIGKYKILYQKLPIKLNTDDQNSFGIDYDSFEFFHQMALNIVPEEIGVISSIMEPTEITFDDNSADEDNVAKAERDFYGSAGVTQFLFNSDKASNASVTKSMEVDQEIVFALYRQIEKWLNRKLANSMGQKNYFKVELLDLTIFNREQMFDMYLQAAQFGIPVKTRLVAMLGVNSFADSMAFLENDVLNLDESFIPLNSAHTSTGQIGQGAPSKREDKLTVEGSNTREGQKNQN